MSDELELNLDDAPKKDDINLNLNLNYTPEQDDVDFP